eukprot:gene8101-12562_t
MRTRQTPQKKKSTPKKKVEKEQTISMPLKRRTTVTPKKKDTPESEKIVVKPKAPTPKSPKKSPAKKPLTEKKTPIKTRTPKAIEKRKRNETVSQETPESKKSKASPVKETNIINDQNNQKPEEETKISITMTELSEKPIEFEKSEDVKVTKESETQVDEGIETTYSLFGSLIDIIKYTLRCCREEDTEEEEIKLVEPTEEQLTVIIDKDVEDEKKETAKIEKTPESTPQNTPQKKVENKTTPEKKEITPSKIEEPKTSVIEEKTPENTPNKDKKKTPISQRRSTRKSGPKVEEMKKEDKVDTEEENDDNEDFPSRPSTSYNMFCADRRATLKEEFPNLKSKEITKKLSFEWKDEDTKKKYQEMYDEAKKEYESKVKEILEKENSK